MRFSRLSSVCVLPLYLLYMRSVFLLLALYTPPPLGSLVCYVRLPSNTLTSHSHKPSPPLHGRHSRRTIIPQSKHLRPPIEPLAPKVSALNRVNRHSHTAFGGRPRHIIHTTTTRRGEREGSGASVYGASIGRGLQQQQHIPHYIDVDRSEEVRVSLVYAD